MIKKIYQFLVLNYYQFKNFPQFGYFYYKYLKIKGYIFFFIEFFFPIKQSTVFIDVIIVVAQKDFNKLESCLTGVRKNVFHPISQIFIIGPKSKKLHIIVKKFKCKYINEDNLLIKKKLNIQYIYNNTDRSGWLYQQFLKYEAILNLGNENYKLVVDADTVFSKKQKFIKNSKIVLNASNSYNKHYFKIASKVLDLKKTSTISFTSHSMLYNQKILADMINYIEKKYKKKYYKAILDNLNYSILSNVSEYELYAQFVINNYKNSFIIEYFFNKDVYAYDLKKYSKNYDTFFYKSLSFHNYLYSK